ncbi:hypothetical protein HJD18_02540 [Thermoleophilia bacterium SCSIO 60948]|nr:hypothetical protein HJD18_02540 [Thermoleophilia bacterium SCSIO 60948]
MERGATSIEKAFAGVAALAVVGLVAVAAALAGPAEMPSGDPAPPIVTESAIGDGTAAVSIASGGAVARSVLTGRRYEPGPTRDCGSGGSVCGRASSWIPPA